MEIAATCDSFHLAREAWPSLRGSPDEPVPPSKQPVPASQQAAVHLPALQPPGLHLSAARQQPEQPPTAAKQPSLAQPAARVPHATLPAATLPAASRAQSALSFNEPQAGLSPASAASPGSPPGLPQTRASPLPSPAVLHKPAAAAVPDTKRGLASAEEHQQHAMAQQVCEAALAPVHLPAADNVHGPAVMGPSQHAGLMPSGPDWHSLHEWPPLQGASSHAPPLSAQLLPIGAEQCARWPGCACCQLVGRQDIAAMEQGLPLHLGAWPWSVQPMRMLQACPRLRLALLSSMCPALDHWTTRHQECKLPWGRCADLGGWLHGTGCQCGASSLTGPCAQFARAVGTKNPLAGMWSELHSHAAAWPPFDTPQVLACPACCMRLAVGVLVPLPLPHRLTPGRGRPAVSIWWSWTPACTTGKLTLRP